MKSTEPWESTVTVPLQPWPQGSRTIGYVNPFSGGVWWDEQHKPKPCFRAWSLRDCVHVCVTACIRA